MVDFSEGEGGWKIPIVPLAVNVILHPLPSPLRCWKLGQALRRAILSYEEDLERRRRRDRWPLAPADRAALRSGDSRLGPGVHAPARRGAESLTKYTYKQLIELGGTESVEVVNWLAMRGALPLDAKPLVQAYYAHRIMGYGLQTFEVAA